MWSVRGSLGTLPDVRSSIITCLPQLWGPSAPLQPLKMVLISVSEVHDLDTHAVTGQVDAEHAHRPSKGVKCEWRAFQLVTSQVKSCFTSRIRWCQSFLDWLQEDLLVNSEAGGDVGRLWAKQTPARRGEREKGLLRDEEGAIARQRWTCPINVVWPTKAILACFDLHLIPSSTITAVKAQQQYYGKRSLWSSVKESFLQRYEEIDIIPVNHCLCL